MRLMREVSGPMTFRRIALLTGMVLVPAIAGPSAAQQTPLTGAQIEALRRNPELVREYIRSSGLTPEQIRSRLQEAGYPATLLDSYLPGSSARVGAPGARELEAIEALGLPF